MPERSTAHHASHDDDAILLRFATLEIALTEEELSMASILEFDPDANAPLPVADATPDTPPMRAISGAAFSRRTWEKLAGRHFSPSPTLAAPQPLLRFLEWRARSPAA
ncbi:hypothetical protein H5V43_03980 [Sphingobium fuliginis]|jgi:hypothetical protein|uniref:Uncharacterized protein n=1 Tax=Sphingobium fuliginis (strain ATCC 27551) TaxID=336203 RepID=A0A7M2GI99_SPHSA|nr:hypothetical protein [Sphingobium fuliginis]QOT72313.1 hypothetical protein H5V43_03980 [Sphingobium fuliginis]